VNRGQDLWFFPQTNPPMEAERQTVLSSFYEGAGFIGDSPLLSWIHCLFQVVLVSIGNKSVKSVRFFLCVFHLSSSTFLNKNGGPYEQRTKKESIQSDSECP